MSAEEPTFDSFESLGPSGANSLNTGSRKSAGTNGPPAVLTARSSRSFRRNIASDDEGAFMSPRVKQSLSFRKPRRRDETSDRQDTAQHDDDSAEIVFEKPAVPVHSTMQGRLRRLPSDLENALPEEWPEDIVLGEKGDEDETEAEGTIDHGAPSHTVSSVGTSGSGGGGTAKISGSAKARTPEWKKAYENRNQQPAVSGSSRLVEMFQTVRDQPVQTTLGPIPEDSETESQRKSDSGAEDATQQAEPAPAAEHDPNGSAGSESGSWDTTSGSTSQSQNVESPFKLFRNKYDTFTNAKVNGILSQLASDGSSTQGSVQDSIRGQSRRGQDVAEHGFRSGPRSGPATGRGTGPSTGPGTLTGRISMDDFRPQMRRTEMVGEDTGPIAKHLSIEQLNARQEHHKQTEQYIKNAQDLFEQLAQSRNVALPDSSEQSIVSDSDGSMRQGAETDPDQSLNELEYSLRQHNPEFSEDERDQDRENVVVQADASHSMDQSFGDSASESASGTGSGASTDDATLPRDSSNSRQFAAPAVPSRTHPGMQQIRADKFQMATYGEMEYDEKEQRWRQKSDSSKFDSHTTKVPLEEGDDDPFQGIEDLADSTEEQPEPMPQHHSEEVDTGVWGQSFEESTKSRVSFRSDGSFQDREFAKRVSSVQQLTIPDIEYTHDDDTDPMPGAPHHDSRVTNNSQPADETQPNAGRRVSSCHSVLQEMVFTPVVNGKKKSVSVLLESPAAPAAADTRYGAASSSTPREATSTHDGEANVTHQTNIDKSMVRVVTDRERENLNWEEITTLEIRGQDLETIATLDRICPKLTTIDASNNRLHVLKGLPAGAISVNVSNNMLTDIAAFDRLARLQRLDLANNNLKSLLGLSRLRHLTDLDVSGNRIESLDGLERLPRLERLAAAGNRLMAVDFGGEAWANVREIDLARNDIGRVESLANLHSVRLLDLSGNRIRAIEFPQLKTLTRLRLSGNGCAADVGSLRALRELLFDANRELRGLERLRELRRLSVQDGSCAAFTAATWSYISDVEELKLSGNNFETFPITVPFLSMRYLEMTNCNLRSLPPAVDTNLLNVRYLDLSFNKLQDLADLAHIPKLEKLFLYSNRFSALSPLLEGLSRLERLVALDLRANPLTAHLHPDIVSLPGLDPGLSDYARYRRSRRAEYRPALEQQESEFLHNVEQHSPDVYEKRQLYQGLALQAVPTLRWFDGLRLSSADVADTLHHMDAMNL